MHRLLDDICFNFNNNNRRIAKSNNLDLQRDYDHYCSAYRFLLSLYQQWRGDQFANPHFDYFTAFLLHLEPKAMPQKMLLMKKALILYGVPGTGKTHAAKEIAETIADRENIKLVQFHPNYSYSDFIIGIKPETTEDGGIAYPTVPGLLYRVAAEAQHLHVQQNGHQGDENRKGNVVLIIDEINRANLAAVLGEVMYLLEYRGQLVTLPQTLSNDVAISRVTGLDNPEGVAQSLGDPFHGGRRFMLPPNLFIIGTMNHADRSIAGFDMALRRRFAWHRTEPDYDALRLMIQQNNQNIQPKILDAFEAFVERAEKLNDKISNDDGQFDSPLTQDHVVGHSYFAEIGSIVQSVSPNATTIERHHREILWLYYIKPLLEDFLGSDARRSASVLEALRKILVDDVQ
jgi:5-methylcytosine-specific restriction endonuclease McrBC GTP-binding regulatory subunit McrB